MEAPKIKPSTFHYDPKSPDHAYSMGINGIAGINNAMAFNKIEDNEFQETYNILPIAPYQCRKVKSPLLMITLASAVVFGIEDIINDTLVTFVILADGSAGTLSSGTTSATYTEVAASGVFSGVANNLASVNWINESFLITDSSNLYSFNGTTLQILPSGISAMAVDAGGSGYAVGDTFTVNNTATGATLGQGTVTAESSGAVTGISIANNGTLYTVANGIATTATTGTGTGLTVDVTALTTIAGNTTIAVWQGRVFLALGRTVTYSVAGSPFDFVSTGSGYFQLSTSDMKQQIIKIVPYMDSIYLVCDHSILSLTGTTISNDPNNWYKMEVFNSLGATNKFSVINYNNTIYLKNEYGMWLISSTQSQKLDYKLNSIGLTYPNLPATVCQINNLNFYLQIINGYSTIKGEYTNMILAYCIDLGEFYYLDFGFNIQGVYATISETDHSIYGWDDVGNIYILFEGTDDVTIYLQSKYFDFDFDFVEKTLEKLALSILLRTGTADIQVCGRALSGNTFQEVTTATQALPNTGLFALYSPTYDTAPIAFTNSYGAAIALGNPLVTVKTAMYYIDVGGMLVSFIIKDTSASVYDLGSLFFRGQIGRALI